MKRMALLFAGGVLWLLLMAAPAFADGGPHTIALMGGKGATGLSGNCAGCHRAHTAEEAYLLKSAEPGLCTSCHNGTGATTNVNAGVQYVPDGSYGTSDPVLGALRGGGFQYALIATDAPDRLSYNSRGGITLTTSAAWPPASGSITLTWTAIGSFPGGDLVLSSTDSVAAVQAKADALFGTSNYYNLSTGPENMTGTPPGNSNIVVTKNTTGSTAGKVWTFAPHNAFRLETIDPPTVTANTTTFTATVADGISVGNTARVGVGASQPVTSAHEGAGTVWGNGAMGSNNAGATGVVLECTNCHNPHGNGMYRILQTKPGSTWKNGTAGVASWTAPTNAVEVIDGPALTGNQVHNYTVRSGYLTSDVDLTSDGDYWRYKWDPSGATNFTNFYLLKDPMSSGWNGQTPTNAAAVKSIIDAIGTKTLAANLAAVDPAGGAPPTVLTLNNVTGFPTHSPVAEPQPLFVIQIDNELMTAQVQRTPTSGTPTGWSTTNLTVTRGFMGTEIVAHTSGTAVTVVSSDPTVDATGANYYNQLGRMTAFCIACHTRYNGWAQNGTASYSGQQTPVDNVFTWKHGTTSTGCEQCHVNHGSNATFSGSALDIDAPDGTAAGSSLLKVNNLNTCMLCHDPTDTVEPGWEVGTIPSLLAPGP